LRKKNPNLQRAGQLGGSATARKYGNEYMQEIGRKGGRPRLLTSAEIRRQQSARREQNLIERGRLAPDNLEMLKELVKIRYSGRLAA
jgi:general stress protein YciG